MVTYLEIRSREWRKRVEGGFANIPGDPGGPTFEGVSQRAVVGLKTANGELQFDLDDDGDVDIHDIRALKDHPELVDEFYRTRYLDAAGCEHYRWPLSLAVFDAAINHGVKPSVVMLQRALGIHADGIPGPKTKRAAALISDDRMERVLRNMLVTRARLYHDLSVKRGPKFFDGWIGRLFDLQAVCLEALR